MSAVRTDKAPAPKGPYSQGRRAGGFLFVDHEDGRTMTLTLWENQAALENSERAAGKLRREAAGSVDGSVLSVETFEVARELTSSSGN